MVRTQTYSSPNPAPRLLSAARALWQLQPVNMADPVGLAQDDIYDFRAHTLAMLLGVKVLSADDGWSGVLGDILRHVDKAGWFEVDWEQVEQDENTDMKIGYGYDDGEDAEDSYLARWLWEVPIARYGFSDWDDSWVDEYPVIGLLKSLLHKEWGTDIVGDWIDHYNLQADWLGLRRPALLHRLETADFSRYPEPLRWLPLIARIALGQTGDPLLDYQNFYEDEPPSYFWWGLAEARAAYRQARPSIVKLNQFLEWCKGADPMQAVVDALTGQDRRKRRRVQRKSKLGTLVDILTPAAERVRV